MGLMESTIEIDVDDRQSIVDGIDQLFSGINSKGDTPFKTKEDLVDYIKGDKGDDNEENISESNNKKSNLLNEGNILVMLFNQNKKSIMADLRAAIAKSLPIKKRDEVEKTWQIVDGYWDWMDVYLNFKFNYTVDINEVWVKSLNVEDYRDGIKITPSFGVSGWLGGTAYNYNTGAATSAGGKSWGSFSFSLYIPNKSFDTSNKNTDYTKNIEVMDIGPSISTETMDAGLAWIKLINNNLKVWNRFGTWYFDIGTNGMIKSAVDSQLEEIQTSIGNEIEKAKKQIK